MSIDMTGEKSYYRLNTGLKVWSSLVFVLFSQLAFSAPQKTSTPVKNTEQVEPMSRNDMLIEALAYQDCSDLSLEELNPNLSKMPHFNQFDGINNNEDVGICYAMTAATLIDAYRISQSPRILDESHFPWSSPLSLALNHKKLSLEKKETLKNSETFADLLNYGSAELSILQSRGINICDHKWLGNSYRETLYEKGDAQLIALTLKDNKSTPPNLRNFLENISQNSQNESPTNDPLKLIENLDSKISAKCQSHQFQSQIPEVRAFTRVQSHSDIPLDISVLRSGGLASQINFLLNSENPQPIGINFCREILTSNPNSQKNYLVDSVNGFNYSCASHSSVIMGRRINQKTKKCQYLIRESSGVRCKDNEGKDKYPLACQSGNLWVDASRISKNAMNIFWISNDKN